MQVSRRSSGESGEQYNRPVPVTLTRVYVAAESFGFHSYIGADRLVFPWRDHLVTVWLDDRDPQALVFDTDLRIRLEMGDVHELAPLINSWNRERLGPTLSMRIGDTGEISIHARNSLLIGTGLSDEQLAESVRGSMETSLLAVTHLGVSFPELALPESDDPYDALEQHRTDQDAAAVDGPLPRDRHHRLIDHPEDDATIEELLAGLPGEGGEDGEDDDGDDDEPGGPRSSSAWWPDSPAVEQPGLFPLSPPSPEEDTGTPPLFRLDELDGEGGEGPDASRWGGRAHRRAHRGRGWNLYGTRPGDRDHGYDDVYAGDDPDHPDGFDATGGKDQDGVNADRGHPATPLPDTDEETDARMNRHHSHHDETSPQLPEPVTVDRIRGTLLDLGVEKTQGGEEVIVAWINEVLFGFFVDNGPSYLVKGHWDPNLDPATDFLRMFLLCNDWNEASVTTKAFCHEDADGLQVRVEFTAPVGEGLNDAQLEHNTAVAINQVLNAIDSISTEATGESAVHWP